LEFTYRPEQWQEAFTVLGTGSAAIAGLLIVAASVRAAEVMAVPYWRLRARNSTLGMLAITFGAILVLVRQDTNVLGVELIILNATSAALLPGPTIIHTLRHHTGLPLRIPLAAACLYALAAAGGISLIAHRGGGLYLTLFSYFGLLLVAVVNAYGLLVPYSNSQKH
jgi:hypothetical protein